MWSKCAAPSSASPPEDLQGPGVTLDTRENAESQVFQERRGKLETLDDPETLGQLGTRV